MMGLAGLVLLREDTLERDLSPSLSHPLSTMLRTQLEDSSLQTRKKVPLASRTVQKRMSIT